MPEDPPDKITYKIITEVPTDEVSEKLSINELKILYKDAGWWDDSFEKNPEALQLIVQNSALFAGAFFKKKLIGMGRALSDKASDAYIQDVAVLTPYRSRGIGGKIIRLLVAQLKRQGVDWIGLVAQPGTQDFYEALGFEVLTGHTPLKYKD